MKRESGSTMNRRWARSALIAAVVCGVASGAAVLFMLRPGRVSHLRYRNVVVRDEPHSGVWEEQFEIDRTARRFVVRTGLRGAAEDLRLDLEKTNGGYQILGYWPIPEGVARFLCGRDVRGLYTVRVREAGVVGTYSVEIGVDAGVTPWQMFLIVLTSLFALTGVVSAWLGHRFRGEAGSGQAAAWRLAFLASGVALFVLFVYLLLHEGGHALASIAFDNFDISRSDFFGLRGSPHSGVRGAGGLAGWQKAVQSIAGPLLPIVTGYILYAAWITRWGKGPEGAQRRRRSLLVRHALRSARIRPGAARPRARSGRRRRLRGLHQLRAAAALDGQSTSAPCRRGQRPDSPASCAVSVEAEEPALRPLLDSRWARRAVSARRLRSNGSSRGGVAEGGTGDTGARRKGFQSEVKAGMGVQAGILVVGLLLLTAGADLLVRGAASLARRLGLTPLVIGLTVVAFGTSAPEMVVSVQGSLQGHGGIAVGNVVGSNIFNVGVILGIAALVSPIRIKAGLIKLDAPLMLLVSVLAWRLLGMGVVSRFGGAFLLLLLAAYVAFSLRLARREIERDVRAEFDDGLPGATTVAGVDLLLVCIGLALLVFGAQLLVRSSMEVARSFGVTEAVIGLTIVAAGTSLPELATSIAAAARGQPDICVGNIIGSNIFNILGILGTASVLRPLDAAGVGRADLRVMVAYAAALLPLIWTGRKLQRWEGGLLLLGYVVYLWFLWPRT